MGKMLQQGSPRVTGLLKTICICSAVFMGAADSLADTWGVIEVSGTYTMGSTHHGTFVLNSGAKLNMNGKTIDAGGYSFGILIYHKTGCEVYNSTGTANITGGDYGIYIVNDGSNVGQHKINFDNPSFRRITISGSTYYGIACANTYQPRIQKVDVSGAGLDGIWLYVCTDGIVIDCELNNNTRYGVVDHLGIDNNIELCTTNDNNSDGIRLLLTTGDYIGNCASTGNEANGISIADAGYTTTYLSECYFNENNIFGAFVNPNSAYTNFLYPICCVGGGNGVYDLYFYSNTYANYCGAGGFQNVHIEPN